MVGRTSSVSCQSVSCGSGSASRIRRSISALAAASFFFEAVLSTDTGTASSSASSKRSSGPGRAKLPNRSLQRMRKIDFLPTTALESPSPVSSLRSSCTASGTKHRFAGEPLMCSPSMSTLTCRGRVRMGGKWADEMAVAYAVARYDFSPLTVQFPARDERQSRVYEPQPLSTTLLSTSSLVQSQVMGAPPVWQVLPI